MHFIARWAVIKLLNTTHPNLEQRAVCQNKISNAFSMPNRMCCESEAAAESLSWRHNTDDNQNKVIEVSLHGVQIFQDQIVMFHWYHHKNLQIYFVVKQSMIFHVTERKRMRFRPSEWPWSCMGNSTWGCEEIRNAFLKASNKCSGQE